jgi:hypothetical protein
LIAHPQHVIPVAADFQRWDCGLVTNRKTGRKLGGRQHRVLQGQRRLASCLELPHVLDRQAEVADEHGDQQTVLGADPPGNPKLEPQCDVARAGKDGDDAARLSWGIGGFDGLNSQR